MHSARSNNRHPKATQKENLPDVEGWRHLKKAVLNTGKIFPKTVFGRESPGDVPFLGDQVVPAKRRKFEQ
jgi:hypothetical protein